MASFQSRSRLVQESLSSKGVHDPLVLHRLVLVKSPILLVSLWKRWRVKVVGYLFMMVVQWARSSKRSLTNPNIQLWIAVTTNALISTPTVSLKSIFYRPHNRWICHGDGGGGGGAGWDEGSYGPACFCNKVA